MLIPLTIAQVQRKFCTKFRKKRDKTKKKEIKNNCSLWPLFIPEVVKTWNLMKSRHFYHKTNGWVSDVISYFIIFIRSSSKSMHFTVLTNLTLL